jgi:hypothetical protein
VYVSHEDAVCELNVPVFTVNTNVAALSHPTELVKCAVCVPAALNVKPFHEYGNSVEQIDKLVLDDVVAFTVNTKLAALSHPTEFVKCAVCVPAALNVKPFHEYGNADGQIDKFVVDVDVCFTLNTNVAALSHPTAFVKCAVCVPAALNVKPFHE